jgi:hypothetical protein
MTASALLAFIGAQDVDGQDVDGRVDAALKTLGTVATPSLDEDDPDQHYDWVLIRKKGVELGFADAAYFAGRPRMLWRHEGLILNQITFYSNTREGVSAFTGELPHGLAMTDSRASVRAKLAAFEGTRRSYLTDCWNIDNYRLIVAYRPQDSGLDSVHIKLPIAPLDDTLRRQPDLDIWAWPKLFGHAASSEALRTALAPLDVLGRIKEDDDEHEVDFIDECGLTLYFEKAGKLRDVASAGRSKGLVFGAVKFYRARDLDARQYGGELPFGLTFDDSACQTYRWKNHWPHALAFHGGEFAGAIQHGRKPSLSHDGDGTRVLARVG